MSSFDLCFPRNEAAQPCYFQNRIIMFCLPISTFIYQCAIYNILGTVCLYCCSQIGSPILGIYKSFIDTVQETQTGKWHNALYSGKPNILIYLTDVLSCFTFEDYHMVTSKKLMLPILFTTKRRC